MNQTINCKIEIVQSPDETVWIISLTEAAVFEAAILLAGKLPQVRFVDKSRSAAIRHTPDGYFLILTKSRQKTQIAVARNWLEELSGSLMYAYATGESGEACIDQNFGDIRLTMTVLPQNG